MEFVYPCTLKSQPEGGYTVTFRDVPSAITEGDTREEALVEAEDALIAALHFYVEDHKPLPLPSKPRRGEVRVPLPPLVSAKLALYDELMQHGLTRVALAERLGKNEGAVRRLLDLDHQSHIAQVDQALEELGKRLVVSVHDAA